MQPEETENGNTVYNRVPNDDDYVEVEYDEDDDIFDELQEEGWTPYSTGGGFEGLEYKPNNEGPLDRSYLVKWSEDDWLHSVFASSENTVAFKHFSTLREAASNARRMLTGRPSWTGYQFRSLTDKTATFEEGSAS